MGKPITIKVSRSHQIMLPSDICQRLNIKARDRLLVDVRDGLLVLAPVPDDYVRYMAGLHGDVWRDVDVAAYLDGERGARS